MKFICFDLDGTLTKESSWQKLNIALGMSQQRDEELFGLYHNSEITYDQWQKLIVESYAHIQKSHREIISSTFENPELISGAHATISQLQAAGYTVVLISGSFDMYVQQVAHLLGIDDYRACSELVFNDDGYIRDVKHSGDEGAAKLILLKELAEKYNVPLTECVCIGDGPNDLEMFCATGKGITFKGTSIEDEAWKVVDSLDDLSKIL